MTEVADVSTGLLYSQDVRLWPFKEHLGVRLWQGDVVLNAQQLTLDEVRFKFKVKCKRKYMSFWRSSKGMGVLKKGGLHYIHITAPEMAIYTSTVQLKINEKLLELQVFKVKNSDNWVLDTTDPPAPPQLLSYKSECLAVSNNSFVLRPFDVNCQLLKPLLASSTLGLREYIQGRDGASVRECLERLVHPVTLEVLSELGNNAGKENKEIKQNNYTMGLATGTGFAPLLEYILLKVSYKLLREDSQRTENGTKMDTEKNNTET